MNENPSAAPTSAPVVQQRLVVFENGMPVVTTQPYIPKAKIQQIALQALSLPYTDDNDELAIEMGLPPSEFYGRPLIEVMLIKRTRAAARTGDDDKIERTLDRAIGKPKTSSENVNLNGSYEDFLKAAAELMKPKGPRPVEDAEIVADEFAVARDWSELE